MVNLSRVNFSYKKEEVLNDFSYSFNDTGMYVIIGESGCGKTTLLNLIGGILNPNSGDISYDLSNIDVVSSISFIFQDNNIFDNLTVLENINLLTNINSNKNITNEEIDSILDKLGILKYKNKKVSFLSGGERQRVSIAIALLLDKKILLADEPLSSLDYKNAEKILNLFKELSKERLIIFSSHNVDILENYCDGIIDLENKKYNDSAEVLEKPIIKRKNLNIKNLFKISNKILGKKIFLNIITLIFFSFCISLLSLLFSLSTTNYGDIIHESLSNNLIRNVYFSNSRFTYNDYNDYSDSFVKIENYLKENGLKFKKGISSKSSFFGDVSVFNVNTIIDESLNDYEIVITESLLDNLKEYGAVDRHLSSENAVGKYITTTQYDLKNQIMKLKIVKVIESNGYFEYNNIFYANDFTATVLDNYRPDVEYTLSVNNSSGYSTFYYYYDNDYEIGSIGLSTTALAAFEQINGRTYSVGDEIEYKIKNDDGLEDKVVTKVIANVFDNDEPLILYPSYEAIEEYLSREVTTPSIYEIYNIGNYDKLVKFYEKYQSHFEQDPNINQGVLSYRNCTNDVNFYSNILLLINMSLYLLIAVMVILFIFASYYVISIYTINKDKFMILKLYGMSKKCEYLLLEFDLFKTMIVSIVLSLVGYIIIGRVVNYLFRDWTGSSANVNLFNFGYLIICVLIVFVVVSILYSLCYIFSSRRIKTHIDK